ncbi:MAG TPA: hypothetical protein VF139_03855 [Candidatus Polarisedimenticolaceae bacterium]
MRPLVLALFVVAAVAAGPAPEPAAGVLASAKGDVRVAARPAAIGDRLAGGAAVETGHGSTATLYLAGGSIVRLGAGQRYVVPAPGSRAPDGARLDPDSAKVTESGLWVLSRPGGSVLLAAMRGDEAVPDPRRARPLSPRYEVVSGTPAFVAIGGPRPVHVVVAEGKKTVWRSAPVDGEGPWSAPDLPSLAPGPLFSWRLESPEGEGITPWSPFRTAPASTFEAGLSGLEPVEADVLRLGYYLESQAWSPLLAASARVLAAHPEAEIARRAWERAKEGLQLDEDGATALTRLLR